MSIGNDGAIRHYFLSIDFIVVFNKSDLLIDVKKKLSHVLDNCAENQ